MDNPIDAYWSYRFETVKNALVANKFIVHVAADAAAAGEQVYDSILPESGAKRLSWGGSMSFKATGLYERLCADPAYDIIDTYDRSIPREDVLERRRMALSADLFFTGTNAITESGMLVNLDMIGNRVGALTFGPKQVVVIAGRNKIVPDLEAAMLRIKNYVAPANAMRLDMNTPCAKTGACQDCSSPDRICNTWTITEKSFPAGRVTVILVNEELGL